MSNGPLRNASLCLLSWGLGVALAMGWSGSAVAAPLERVTLQLKWHHQFQFAGYYAAQQQGYYRDAGLEVELREADAGLDPVEEVVQGRAQYGVGNSSLLLARQQGKPVVVLAVILQHSPLVLIGRQDAGIRTIHDLAGKRVMLEVHAEEILAYLQREGVSASALTLLPHTLNSTDLVEGRVDGETAYLTDEPYFLDRSGLKYSTFTPRSSGIDFYGDNLFTHAQEIQEHPDRVRAFRTASLKGWQYALQHPEEMIALILARYGGNRSREHLRFEARQMATLINYPLVEMGYMHEGRWQHIAQTYGELDLLPKAFSLEGFLYDPNAQLRQERQRLMALAAIALLGCGLLATVAIWILRLNHRLGREGIKRAALTAHLQESERKFRFITEHTADVIWTMDLATRRFTYISPSVYQLRGYTPEEAMTQSLAERLTPDSQRRLELVLAEALASWQAGGSTGAQWVTEVEQPHKDGHLVTTEVVTTLHADAKGKHMSVLGVSRDITARKFAEQQLTHAVQSLEELASTDLLTQAWNRRRFDEAVKGEMHRSRRYGHPLSLLLLDIDFFKRVNDTHGHHAGDRVLQEVAQRIRKVLRQSDSLTRWGGEEFIVLMPNTGLSGATLLADRIRLSIGGAPVDEFGKITASAGVAEYLPQASLEAWIQRADRAMYEAKAQGRNRVEADQARRVEASADPDESGAFFALLWRDAFLSGHPAMDAQHQKLFQLINEFLTAMLAQQPQEALLELIQRLLQEVAQHFHDEELVLADLRFPGLLSHGVLHANLLTKARALAASFAEGGTPLGQLFQFLAQDLVAGHILKADREWFPLTAGTEPDPPESFKGRL